MQIRCCNRQSAISRSSVVSSMRLERLEINGFKSFSDRSELAFDKGVTAIVGPNGCGKSNVADAITWVMGEQSAKSLRGDKMEDVIFSGSDARKPTAAAEVRLRFSGVLKTVSGPAFPAEAAADEPRATATAMANGNGHGNGNGNGNGHGMPRSGQRPRSPAIADVVGIDAIIQSVAREVEVTRRLYRSGESEYLIDGQICRLRDVHDLLMDTGLGAKAYAIIEQGKIGMILSSRPTDRRQLIEEAAGVTKYKARRRVGGAEARGGAAEPHAHRRHRLRGREAARHAEAPGGQGAALPEAARRAAALGEGAVRAEVPPARRDDRVGARAAGRRARARVGGGGARRARSSRISGALRIELVEAESQRDRSRARRRTRASSRSPASSSRSRSTASRCRRSSARDGRRRGRARRRSRRAASRRASRSRRAATRRPRPTPSAIAPRRRWPSESDAYEAAHREIEGLEADVEAARSEVFSAHQLGDGAAPRARARGGRRATASPRRCPSSTSRRATSGSSPSASAAERAAAADGLRRAHDAIEATRIARAARESELASARIEHEWRVAIGPRPRARAGRPRGAADVARGARGRARRLRRRGAHRARAGQRQGQPAGRDRRLPRGRGRLRARGRGLPRRSAPARRRRAAGARGRRLPARARSRRRPLRVPRDRASARRPRRRRPRVDERHRRRPATRRPASAGPLPDGVVALSSVVRVNGPFAAAIRQAIGEAWIADVVRRAPPRPAGSRRCRSRRSTATCSAARTSCRAAGRDEARGILETKREIKELRERIAAEREALTRLAQETAELEATIAQASNAIAALNAEHHKQEKAVVGLEAQLQHADRRSRRGWRRRPSSSRASGIRPKRSATRSIAGRRRRARRSPGWRTTQRQADERLTVAQRRLFEAREAAEDLSRRAAEAGAAHAALVERAGALALEVQRLEEAGAELEAARGRARRGARRDAAARRRAARGDRRRRGAARRRRARARRAARRRCMTPTRRCRRCASRADEHEAAIKDARGALDAIRAVVVRARRRARHRRSRPLAPGAHVRGCRASHARRGARRSRAARARRADDARCARHLRRRTGRGR